MNKILLIDDDVATNFYNNYMLKKNTVGCEIIMLDNGLKALDYIKKHTLPDAIFVDVNMPVMDGITLIRELRGLPNYKFTPLLMLTTESGMDKKVEGKAAGATGWIVKPFNPDQLLAVLKKVIR